MAKVKQTSVAVPFASLRDLLGKPVDDPAVTAVFAGAGKVKVGGDYIVAKDAGFDFALERPASAKRNAKKILTTLFLFPEGGDGHRAFTDLPAGFSFSTREALLASLPTPSRSWVIGTGEVPVTTANVSGDRWLIDGFEYNASYSTKTGEVRHITVSLTDDAMGGARLATYPLHFATRPADALPDAELTAMALLVAWAADRFGLPPKHASSPFGEQLLAHTLTPRAFLVNACHKTLTSQDFVPELADFLGVYTGNVFIGPSEAREKASEKIRALLHTESDKPEYGADYLGTFIPVVENPFYVPDSWEAVARLSPVIDARYADFQMTKFRTSPNMTLYEKAAKARDMWSVQPARATLAHVNADATLASDLVALIDQPLSDKLVKATLTRAGLPIGKKIDQQANPALGVAYMGAKFEIAGKKQLGVEAVTFFADQQKRYIRGLGAEVEFVGFRGPLPRGLVLGMTRAEVLERLGRSSRSSEDTERFVLGEDRILLCTFEGERLVVAHFGKPVEY